MKCYSHNTEHDHYHGMNRIENLSASKRKNALALKELIMIMKHNDLSDIAKEL